MIQDIVKDKPIKLFVIITAFCCQCPHRRMYRRNNFCTLIPSGFVAGQTNSVCATGFIVQSFMWCFAVAAQVYYH